MRDSVFRTLTLLILLIGGITSVFAGEKWRVTDQDLTVWDSPEYLNKLGVIHRGYEIDALAVEGDMIRFEYEGKTAYVATYCCELITEGTSEPTSELAASGQMPAQNATHPEIKQIATDTPLDEAVQKTEEVDDSPSFAAKILLALAVPLGIAYGAIAIVALIFTFFYAFKYEKLKAWFDTKAGCDCIPEKRFNYLLKKPVIALLLMIGVNFLATMMLSGTTPDNINFWKVLLIILAVGLVVGIPFLVLRAAHRKYAETYGKKAAKWMTIYSLLSIVALYTIAVIVIYIVLAIVAIMALIFLVGQTKSGGALSMDDGANKADKSSGCSGCIHYTLAECDILDIHDVRCPYHHRS